MKVNTRSEWRLRLLTFDKASRGKFYFSGHDNFGRVWAVPGQAGPGFDAECVSARDIGCPRSCDIGDVMIEIDKLVLVSDLAFCLFWSDTAIERLDVAHVALQEM